MLTDPNKHRWLLVTGTPRSGTTFLGEMLDQSVAVNSFIEPFNPHGGVPWVHQRYLYFPSADELDATTRTHFEDFFSYRFTQRTYVHGLDKPLTKWRKRLLLGGNELLVWRGRFNPFARVSLIKDPIAVFLIDVFLDLRPVHVFGMIRHPLSYAGSLKRLGWDFELEPLLNQPALMERYLPDFEERNRGKLTPMKACAWIWLAINRYLLDVSARRPGVDLIFHEEMSKAPLESIRWCHARTGLDWDSKKEGRVRSLTDNQQSVGARAGIAHDFKRNSRDIFAQSIAWLDDEERHAVMSIVAPVAETLYAIPDQPELSARGRSLMAIQ